MRFDQVTPGLASPGPVPFWWKVTPGADWLIERVAAERMAIGEAALEALLTLPSFSTLGGPSLDEMRQHCLHHLDAFLQAARTGRLPGPNELGFIQEAASLYAREGLDARPMLEGYRLCPRVKSDWILRIGARTSEPPETALVLVRVLMDFSLHASGLWVDTYLAETQKGESETEALAASVIGDLISGMPAHQLDDRVRRARVDPAAANQVAVVAATDLAKASAATKREVLMSRSPHLLAVWGEQLVVLAPARLTLMDVLRRACDRAPLRAGISLPFTGLDSFRQAHAEALEALTLAGPGRVVRLQDLRLFDYLLSRPTTTAHRLVPAVLRQLDAVHRHTLRTFADCDLNAEQAARRLNVHPNTVHYRLRKIEELTGSDVRRLPDLIELLAGISILEANSNNQHSPG